MSYGRPKDPNFQDMTHVPHHHHLYDTGILSPEESDMRRRTEGEERNARKGGRREYSKRTQDEVIFFFLLFVLLLYQMEQKRGEKRFDQQHFRVFYGHHSSSCVSIPLSYSWRPFLHFPSSYPLLSLSHSLCPFIPCCHPRFKTWDVIQWIYIYSSKIKQDQAYFDIAIHCFDFFIHV